MQFDTAVGIESIIDRRDGVCNVKHIHSGSLAQCQFVDAVDGHFGDFLIDECRLLEFFHTVFTGEGIFEGEQRAVQRYSGIVVDVKNRLPLDGVKFGSQRL